MSQKRLNIGCGRDVKEGWVNLDRVNLPGTDVVLDIERETFPFDDNEFDEILCKDVLEHVEYISVLAELYRILRVGGLLRIRVPHFSSRENYVDPTHKHMFSISTFEFFCRSSDLFRDYYFDFNFEKVSFSRMVFYKRRFFVFNHVIEYLVNSGRTMKQLYESTFLSRLVPADYIELGLIK